MIRLEKLTLSAGGHDLLVGADWHVHPNDRIGLVGRNGSGKTTLLRALLGKHLTDGGQVHLRGDVTLGYLPQGAVSGSTAPLWDEVASGMTGILRLEERLKSARAAVEAQEPGAIEALGEAEEAYRIAGGYAKEERVGQVLHGLGFVPGDWKRTCDTFSGGWQMRIALARLLLSDANVLLLDEPTNHLDVLARSWLADFLVASPRTLILVSHDRHLLDTVCNRITEVWGQSLHDFTGNLSSWERERAQRRAHQQAAYEAQQEEIARLERFITRFKAKATKAAQARSRMKQLERMERIEAPTYESEPTYILPEPQGSAAEAMVLTDVSLGWPDGPTVLEGVDLSLHRGMKLAVLGVNGSGKTTLLHAMAGRLSLRAGRRLPGDRVRVGLFTQDLAQELPRDESGLDYLGTVAPTADLTKIWGALGALGLGGDKAQQPISTLSGGERARVALSAFALKPHDLLLFDEPTNHLDAVSVKVLGDALADFAGTVVVVTHDRWLVERMATHVALVEDGKVTLHEGVHASDFELKPPSTDSSDGPSEAALSYEEKKRRDREAERARRRIAAIAEEVESLEEQMAALDEKMFEITDYEKSAALAEERNAFAQKVEALYAEWEQLEGT